MNLSRIFVFAVAAFALLVNGAFAANVKYKVTLPIDNDQRSSIISALNNDFSVA